MLNSLSNEVKMESFKCDSDFQNTKRKSLILYEPSVRIRLCFTTPIKGCPSFNIKVSIKTTNGIDKISDY